MRNLKRLMWSSWFTIAVLALWWVPSASLGQGPILAIEGGTLIDGTGNAPVPDSVIVIEGNRIKAVGSKSRITIPPGAQIIPAAGKTILPGLIDAHIHFLDYMPTLFLHFGVTTVFDTANPTQWILAQRNALNSGKYPGPRMYVTGVVIDGPALTGSALTTADRGGYKVRVASVDEARAVVRGLISEGVDAVKVHEQLSPELLRAIVDEAHKAGREVVGHSGDARDATLAGFKFIEHSTPIAHALLKDPRNRDMAGESPAVPEADMDPRQFDPLIDLLVKHGVYYNPTLTRLWFDVYEKRRQWSELATTYLNDPSWKFIPEARRMAWLENAARMQRGEGVSIANSRRKLGLQNVIEFTKRFARAGGKVITGPDSGPSSGPANAAGLAMHIEMEALVDAGLTPMQAILASTSWSAELMRVEKELGTIEAGKLADLLLIEGDPLLDIRATRRIQAVILNGKVVDTKLDANFRNPLPRPVYIDSPLDYLAPEIISVSPAVVDQGGHSVRLRITGRKFAPRSFVRLDTVDLVTQFESETLLTAEVPTAALRTPGTFAVTVVTPGSGGGASNSQYIVVDYRD